MRLLFPRPYIISSLVPTPARLLGSGAETTSLVLRWQSLFWSRQNVQWSLLHMIQNNQRGANKQNTQLCMFHKMRVTKAVNQAAVPPLISHQWRPRGNLQHDQDEREPLKHMMEDHNREKEKRHLSQPMTRLLGQGWPHLEERRDLCCLSQLCPNHQWERWLGGWMKHLNFSHSLLVQTLLEVFITTVDEFRLGVLIRHEEFMFYSDKPG